MSGEQIPNDYPIKALGQNINFAGCYFALGRSSQNYFGIRALMQVGSYVVSMNSCMFEVTEAGSNLTPFSCGTQSDCPIRSS